jgi:hypothetical protein
MSKQTINIGASPNDGTGTPLRTSFDYTNQNFTEIYTALGGGVALPGATTQVIFNDGGTNLAGDAGLVYNKTTDALTVAGLVTAGSATITGAATVGTTLGVTGVSTLTGNVGVGNAPSAWSTTFGLKATQVYNSALASNGTSGYLTNNAYYATGAYTPTYINAASTPAQGIVFNSTGANDIQFLIGAAGTAGNTIAGFATAAMTLNSTGNLAFPTGKGIDFSAVTGGTGTATANVLNDYEEGTWTMGMTFGGGNTALTTATNTGRYTKVGRLVTVSGYFSLTNKGTSTGAAKITGLPFTVESSAASYQTASLRLNGVSYVGAFQAFGSVSLTTIALEQISILGVVTDLNDTNFTNSSAIMVSLTYTV